MQYNWSVSMNDLGKKKKNFHESCGTTKIFSFLCMKYKYSQKAFLTGSVYKE